MQPVALPAQGILGDLATGINHASDQLIRQESALNKRDNARTTWIAGISHDIRTPLSVIMGYAGQMEEDNTLNKKHQELAVTIRTQCQKIKALINDLNLASKLEYDMQPIRKEEFLLAPLIRSIVAELLNSNCSPRYTLSLSIDENAQNTSIIGDSQLIKRAITNIILNSMRHNPDGCDITIQLNTGSGTVFLSVTDNGTGFPVQTLKRLNHPMEPMELDNHGLGLTIVRQIMKAHNGTAAFSNLTGGGCRVTLLWKKNHKRF
ncbi:sensor histidine kinase [Lacrimispora xylanisolvens]|uniref:sensor histidine kinase n=1 Tax=Lacrimispora xylanisolvens TaxID=384636 RepID=UPI002402ACF6